MTPIELIELALGFAEENDEDILKKFIKESSGGIWTEDKLKQIQAAVNAAMSIVAGRLIKQGLQPPEFDLCGQLLGKMRFAQSVEEVFLLVDLFDSSLIKKSLPLYTS